MTESDMREGVDQQIRQTSSIVAYDVLFNHLNTQRVELVGRKSELVSVLSGPSISEPTATIVASIRVAACRRFRHRRDTARSR